MSPLLLTGREVIPLSNLPIQKVWLDSYDDYCLSQQVQSPEQRKASRAILACKSGGLGVNVSRCSECGHMEFHNNSCRSRSCPNCQGVFKELWSISAGRKSSIPLTSMWCLRFLMSSIP